MGLDVSNNQLTSLDFSQSLQLKILNISNNLLTKLPESTLRFIPLWDPKMKPIINIGANCRDRSSMSIELNQFVRTLQAGSEKTVQTAICPIPAFCATVTDVPEEQCEALLALYNHTDGAHWTNNTNR